MAYQLSPLETRILGCLIEKEQITPENYPLSLHSLTAACNQTTNRDPVVDYDEKTVEQGLFSLRQKKLASLVMVAGARVQKFRHHLLDEYDLDRRELALMTVLLLRGPQTPGELRTRTERFCSFAGVEEAERCLQGLAEGDQPLVRALPARAGQKEKRYVQLLSGEPDLSEPPPTVDPLHSVPPAPSRIESLENEVRTLKTDLAALREEFTRFRQQFE